MYIRPPEELGPCACGERPVLHVMPDGTADAICPRCSASERGETPEAACAAWNGARP